jgi:PAS domain-containing protein
MKAETKIKDKLINELAEVRQQITQLGVSETKCKRDVKALRKARQEKAAILDSMSEFVVHQDTKMRVLWGNRAAGETVGLAPEQLVGHYCYKI